MVCHMSFFNEDFVGRGTLFCKMSMLEEVLHYIVWMKKRREDDLTVRAKGLNHCLTIVYQSGYNENKEITS